MEATGQALMLRRLSWEGLSGMVTSGQRQLYTHHPSSCSLETWVESCFSLGVKKVTLRTTELPPLVFTKHLPCAGHGARHWGLSTRCCPNFGESCSILTTAEPGSEPMAMSCRGSFSKLHILLPEFNKINPEELGHSTGKILGERRSAS